MHERRKTRANYSGQERRSTDHSYHSQDDSLLSTMATIATAEIISSAIDTPSFDSSPSIDTSSFGGFGGGESGGGGASGSW